MPLKNDKADVENLDTIHRSSIGESKRVIAADDSSDDSSESDFSQGTKEMFEMLSQHQEMTSIHKDWNISRNEDDNR